MELDMYLCAKRYIWSDEHDLKNAVNDILDRPCPVSTSETEWEDPRVSGITLTVGYWRRANAIHAWFVKNVQSGKDDCEEYNVSLEQLRDLRSNCQKVLEKKSRAPGDKWYYDAFEHTIKVIDYIEKNIPTNKYEFYYHSSW